MAPRPSTSAAAAAAAAPKKKGDMKQGSLFSFFSKKEPKAASASQPLTKVASAAAPPVVASTATLKPSGQPAAADAADKQQQPPPPLPQNRELLRCVQIGTPIEVYWSEDATWYGAKVTKLQQQQQQRSSGCSNAPVNKYHLEYDDGQCEWIDLATETFRLKKPKKRRIQEEREESDEEEEAEFEMPASEDDESSAYREDAKAEDDDDDDEDQWMVTDDEDEIAVGNKSKTKPSKKQKISSESSAFKKTSGTAFHKASSASRPTTTTSTTTSSTKSGSVPSFLSKFAAGQQVTVTEHGKTPRSISSTPKQITPGTGLLGSFSQPSPPAAVTRTTAATVAPKQTQPQAAAAAAAPAFEVGALNPAGSHLHNHLPFLRNPLDAEGRSPDHADYDPRTLKVQERDWIKLNAGKKMTDAVKQWWDLKGMYFDTVLLFKTGTSSSRHLLPSNCCAFAECEQSFASICQLTGSIP